VVLAWNEPVQTGSDTVFHKAWKEIGKVKVSAQE